MKKKIIGIINIALLLVIMNTSQAQAQATTSTKSKKTAVAWDGMIVAGYVNHGAFVNFGGPCLKLIKKPMSFSFSFLPSIRVKEDKVPAGAKKNSIITPNLGCGITASYKHLALQMPVYYNPKTAAANGKWNVGIGVGYKF